MQVHCVFNKAVDEDFLIGKFCAKRGIGFLIRCYDQSRDEDRYEIGRLPCYQVYMDGDWEAVFYTPKEVVMYLMDTPPPKKSMFQKLRNWFSLKRKQNASVLKTNVSSPNCDSDGSSR